MIYFTGNQMFISYFSLKIISPNVTKNLEKYTSISIQKYTIYLNIKGSTLLIGVPQSEEYLWADFSLLMFHFFIISFVSLNR